MGGNENTTLSHFPPRAGQAVLRMPLEERPVHWRKVTQFRHLFLKFDFHSCFDTKRLLFVIALLIIWFHDVHENSNNCDKITVWEWQRQGIGITDGTENGMEIKHG